jgi:hypothetical protein
MSRKNYKYDILLVATFKRKTYVTYGKVMDSYETLGGTSVKGRSQWFFVDRFVRWQNEDQQRRDRRGLLGCPAWASPRGGERLFEGKPVGKERILKTVNIGPGATSLWNPGWEKQREEEFYKAKDQRLLGSEEFVEGVQERLEERDVLRVLAFDSGNGCGGRFRFGNIKGIVLQWKLESRGIFCPEDRWIFAEAFHRAFFEIGYRVLGGGIR